MRPELFFAVQDQETLVNGRLDRLRVNLIYQLKNPPRRNPGCAQQVEGAPADVEFLAALIALGIAFPDEIAGPGNGSGPH